MLSSRCCSPLSCLSPHLSSSPAASPSLSFARSSGSPTDGVVAPTADHAVCFEFTGWIFDSTTNKFTDYELVFASCEPDASSSDGSYQSSSFQIRGRIRVAEPSSDIDLTDMHGMLPNSADRAVTASNWTDLRFHLSMGVPCGTDQDGNPSWCSSTQTGRSIYEKYEAVGCAKAMENGGEVSMCFNDATLKSSFPSSGGSMYQGVRPACKSRLQTFLLSSPRYYRAYKLCDDDACSGTHDCKESGPTNNVNFYTCKQGATRSDGTPGCSYKDRAVQGYLYVWNAENGAHLWSYPAHHHQEDWEAPFPPSMPPPPPSPPPEEAVAYIPDFPDGTEVWKEEYTSDDKKYTVRRVHGRLVRVLQNSMRLCDMPGTYTVDNSGQTTVSFEVDVVGGCDGSLKVSLLRSVLTRCSQGCLHAAAHAPPLALLSPLSSWPALPLRCERGSRPRRSSL